MQQIAPSEEFTPQTEAIFTTVISTVLNNIVLDDMLKSLKKLESGYEETIKNLATVDPLIAYRLSGKTSIFETLKELKPQLSSLAELFQNQATNIDSEIKQILDILRPDLANEIVKTLEGDIIEIAWGINTVIWWKMKGRLKKFRQINNKEMDKYIDSLFTKIEPMLIAVKPG